MAVHNMDNRIIRLIIILVVFRRMEIIINFVRSLGLSTNKRKVILRIHSDKSEMTKWQIYLFITLTRQEMYPIIFLHAIRRTAIRRLSG